MSTYDTWGGSWGTSWAVSWTRGTISTIDLSDWIVTFRRRRRGGRR